MEYIIFHYIMGHLDAHHLLVTYQHGFHRAHSCESQLITIVEHRARNLDHGRQTHVLLLDFSKTFDTVPHKRLMEPWTPWNLWTTDQMDRILALWKKFRQLLLMVHSLLQ